MPYSAPHDGRLSFIFYVCIYFAFVLKSLRFTGNNKRNTEKMNGIAHFRLCTLTDKQLIQEVDRLTDEMFKTGKVPSCPVPARPDKDLDLLTGELILRFHARILADESIILMPGVDPAKP